jgi:hypothetical protein
LDESANANTFALDGECVHWPSAVGLNVERNSREAPDEEYENYSE